MSAQAAGIVALSSAELGYPLVPCQRKLFSSVPCLEIAPRKQLVGWLRRSNT